MCYRDSVIGCFMNQWPDVDGNSVSKVQNNQKKISESKFIKKLGRVFIIVKLAFSQTNGYHGGFVL